MLQALTVASPFGLTYPEAAAPLGVITDEVTMSLGSLPTIDATGLHGGHLMGASALGIAGVLGYSLLGAAAAGGMAMLMSMAIRSKHPLRNPFIVGFGAALAGNLVLGFLAFMAVRGAAGMVSLVPPSSTM